MDHNVVNYDNKKYGIIKITYQSHEIPTILNYNDYTQIKKMNVKWKCNNSGYVYCNYINNGVSKDIYLHELVMALNNKKSNHSILHINKIGVDNRLENLMFDTPDKEMNKNIKKKTRTIKLPKNCGVEPNQIPTYIWYMKADDSHGERFVVDIGNFKWKTTSSKDLSLKYKLEEAKLFMRELLRHNPKLIDEYSMNGDLTKEGKELLKTFYDIIHLAGFKHIKRIDSGNSTRKLLKPNHNSLKTNLIESCKLDKKSESDLLITKKEEFKKYFLAQHQHLNAPSS